MAGGYHPLENIVCFFMLRLLGGETSALPSSGGVHRHSQGWKPCKPGEPFFLLS